LKQDKSALYERIVVDHTKNPRNFRAIESPVLSCEECNPICGDDITVYLRVENGVITDASFMGSGCAISKSSASLMTEAVKGLGLEDAAKLSEKFHRMLSDDASSNVECEEELGELQSLRSVRDYPVRIKCATLSWRALTAALDLKKESL
jgi:nitrogen fixation NifU-like protein